VLSLRLARRHTIAGKRESHELAVLLSLPFSRRDVVAGSYAGRAGLVVVTLASLYATAITASLLTGTPLDPGLLAVGFVLLTVIGCVFAQLSPFAALRNVLVPVSETLAANFPVIGSGVPTDPPAYQQPWFGAIVLLVWLVVPVLAGYYRFERSDL